MSLRIFPPTAFPRGQYLFARYSSTRTTFGAVAVSTSVKLRPLQKRNPHGGQIARIHSVPCGYGRALTRPERITFHRDRAGIAVRSEGHERGGARVLNARNGAQVVQQGGNEGDAPR